MGLKFVKDSDFKKATSDTLKEVILADDMEFVYKIDYWLEKRGLLVVDLAAATGIRIATINDYAKNTLKNQTINIAHMFAIMAALRLTDISDLFEVKMSLQTKKKYQEDARAWTEDGIIPTEVADRILERKSSTSN